MAACLLTLLVLLVAAGCRSPRPRLALDLDRLDLGVVPAGESVDAALAVRNEGGAPLTITGADGGCGCITVRYPRSIPAGGVAVVEVRFAAEPDWEGPVRKNLTLWSDDPGPGMRRSLPLLAQVVPLVEVRPGRALELPYSRGEMLHTEMVLVPREGAGLRIRGASTASPIVRPTSAGPGPGDPPRARRLRLAVGPCRGPGDFEAWVRVETTDPRLPELPLLLIGRARSGVVVEPARIDLGGNVGTGPGAELRRIRVFTRSGELRLLRAEVDRREIIVESSAVAPGRAYEIVLRSSGGWGPGPFSANIRIFTDDPQAPVFTVPVVGRVP